MAREKFFERLTLIIKRLERSPATFEEIKRHLEDESANLGINLDVSIRTLQRDIKQIEELFKITIVNERKGDKRYHIREQADAEHSKRLMEAYAMVNVLNASKENSKYMFFESRQAKGAEDLNELLHACRYKKITSFDYIKYGSAVLTSRIVHPLLLKEARGRWYLIAAEEKNGVIKTFGLDRIQNLDISKTAFREKYETDINASFEHVFGIINKASDKPTKIKLLLPHEQAQYVINFPLHHSQKIIEEKTDTQEVVLELFLKISYDFEMELMSFGPALKVLSPKILISRLVNRAKTMIEMYEA